MDTRDNAAYLSADRRHWLAVTLSVALTLGVLALVFALAPTAHAATTVNCNRGDDLQKAIDDPAAAGTTLKIRGRCVGTFTIDKDLTLRGLRRNATLDAKGAAGPVVTVNGARVALKNLKITGGKASGTTAIGGILNDGGDLTLNRTRVVGNRAIAAGPDAGAVGGIQTGQGWWGEPGGGSLTLIRSIVSRNRAVNTGGIFATGGIGQNWGPNTLTLRRTTVSGNRATVSAAGASAVGGISSASTLALRQKSVVKKNRATSPAAGGFATGGVENFDGLATLRNSKVKNNAAAAPAGQAIGGIFDRVAGVTLTASLVTTNTPPNCNFVAPGCAP